MPREYRDRSDPVRPFLNVLDEGTYFKHPSGKSVEEQHARFHAFNTPSMTVSSAIPLEPFNKMMEFLSMEVSSSAINGS